MMVVKLKRYSNHNKKLSDSMSQNHISTVLEKIQTV